MGILTGILIRFMYVVYWGFAAMIELDDPKKCLKTALNHIHLANDWVDKHWEKYDGDHPVEGQYLTKKQEKEQELIEEIEFNQGN
jgi:hypothetical protein